MAFVQAMNTQNTTKTGVNGADVYTEEGVGDYRVTLFTMLNRDLNPSYISEYVDKIYARGNADEIRDLFVMAFQLRDIRGGKGERKLFYFFIKQLYMHDAATVVAMLKFIPEYGCWRDMWAIYTLVPELEADILAYTRMCFINDLAKCNADMANKMSLLAKWLPRERSKRYPDLARKLASHIYSFVKSERKQLVMYRKDVSMMNAALKTVEINMCGKRWADIKPEAVPGRCLSLHTDAFLNKTTKTLAGIRYPDNKDRMLCREHFQKFIEDLKNGTRMAHGAHVVMPHELVEKTEKLRAQQGSEEHAIIQAQWDAIRDETLKHGKLGKCVPMCDFSGSMDGRPKLISLALGILISEVNHGAFKDYILTFSADPEWHSFVGKFTLLNKLRSINGMIGQGLNTDFYKACMYILNKMKLHKVPVGEEPESLVVLTDMGFDVASRSSSNWTSLLKMIQQEFKTAGEEVWGVGNGWQPPRIVIWNLRTEYKDFYATAHEENVVNLSGWSPSMLRVLQTDGIVVSTSYQGLRCILDNVRYDAVRNVWDSLHYAACAAITVIENN